MLQVRRARSCPTSREQDRALRAARADLRRLRHRERDRPRARAQGAGSRAAATSSSTRPRRSPPSTSTPAASSARRASRRRSPRSTSRRQGDRLPAPAAQHRRHHHLRLHRHGEATQNREKVFKRFEEALKAGQGQDQRHQDLRARPGRDDPQAHARVASAACCTRPAPTARARAT